MIDKLPEIMLMIVPGMKNGEIFRAPPARKSLWVSSIIGRPPMPEPILTPIRSALPGPTSRPESRKAWIPAAMPKWMKTSIRRASLADR